MNEGPTSDLISGHSSNLMLNPSCPGICGVCDTDEACWCLSQVMVNKFVFSARDSFFFRCREGNISVGGEESDEGEESKHVGRETATRTQ